MPFPVATKCALTSFPEDVGMVKELTFQPLFLMQSENDENIEWPMRGIFSVRLLNQEGDQTTSHAQYALRKQK